MCGLRTQKYVCFKCRLCFHSGPPACPECKEPLVAIGVYFRAPRRTKIKEWQKLEKMTSILGPGAYGREGTRSGLLRTQSGLSKSAKKNKMRDEAFYEQMRIRWKTCPWCGKFMKKGLHNKHSEVCSQKNVPVAQMEECRFPKPEAARSSRAGDIKQSERRSSSLV
jgi:hypothetical protein